MNRRTHARLAKQLIDACGGLVEAQAACRVRKSVLNDYAQPHGEGFMPADVIADLEAYCGAPIYSKALFEGRPEASEGRVLTEEACEATEAVSELQKAVRLAVSKGPLTPTQRTLLARIYAEARAELDQVGLLVEGDQ